MDGFRRSVVIFAHIPIDPIYDSVCHPSSHEEDSYPNKFVFSMILMNSSWLTSPSPSLSASSIISCNSSSEMLSPSSIATLFKLRNEIFPVSSSSNKRNALMISSRESLSPIFVVIIVRNSGKSTCEFPSLSISEMSLRISSFVGSNPSARIATLSSFASMVPDPSVSKRSNASRISCFWSSVSSGGAPFLVATGFFLATDFEALLDDMIE
mmetsp:Transcript_54154/g.115066  ORF Transcript_54154/g.115066 Transcript_54154/m.115066 type:complete len:211 (+) Transcript_54154:67-699(+)